MMDWTFRITSPAALSGDLVGFCVAFGYAGFPNLAERVAADPDENFVYDENNGHLRFDFDFLRLLVDDGNGGALDRGCHVNVRAMVLPGNGQTGEDALALLDSQLRGFFAQQVTITNDAPAPLTGGQVWHTTGNTALIDPAPAMPKRVWA